MMDGQIENLFGARCGKGGRLDARRFPTESAHECKRVAARAADFEHLALGRKGEKRCDGTLIKGDHAFESVGMALTEVVVVAVIKRREAGLIESRGIVDQTAAAAAQDEIPRITDVGRETRPIELAADSAAAAHDARAVDLDLVVFGCHRIHHTAFGG